MALIGKIRKNFWFVLILLGLALAAFILMDMTSAGNAGGAASSLTLGSVAGQKIDYRAFQQAESSYYRNQNVDNFTKRKSIWDFFVEKIVVEKEASALGLGVSKDELMDLQFGTVPSEVIRRNWVNPQTGQLDQASLQQFRSAIENNEEMNPEFRAYWAEQEKQILKEEMQKKLNNIVKKSVFTPSWMAEQNHVLDNKTVDFRFVKIPFDQIDGAGITVSDSDINSYVKSNGKKYDSPVEKRIVEYVTFDVRPTAADSASIRERMSSLKAEFLRTNDDSLFAVSNAGTYNHLYAPASELPVDARTQITNLEPGEVYGPFHAQGRYIVTKMIDKKRIPDTVSAQHILRNATRGDVASEAAAKKFIDSLRNEYRRGVSFDTLAVRHSQDPGSGAKGGDLGEFTQTTMVPEFATACFANGTEGGIYTVQTQFGYHLIKVNKRKFNDDELKYRISTISTPITPSQETQDARYDLATQIVTANRDANSLRAALKDIPNVYMQESPGLVENDYNIGDLGATNSTREIIRWAYDPSTEVGEVSPEIFQYTDPVNYYDNKYVLASLKSIIPKGLPSAANIRSEVEPLLLNKKKAEKYVAGLSYNTLEELATAHGVEVKTSSGINYKAAGVPGLGTEREAVATAFKLDAQAISKPIVGETGVIVVQPLSVSEPAPTTNLATIKQNLTNTVRSQVDFNLIKNMKKRSDIEDGRKEFF